MSETDRRLRLLCLDGGGVRGLASLYLLRKLLALVGNPKPCDYFDMICGTSTGGLIAIMLGRLEMNINDCIEAFVGMMDAIFQQKHRLPFKLFSGQVQPRFDSAILEKCIKAVIITAGFDSEAKLRETKQSKCKVFVAAMTEEAKTIVHFTDYPQTGGEHSVYNDIKIWEAARATSAATSFFAPIKIVSGGVPRVFVDGALGANNPVDELWFEAAEEWGPQPLEPQIGCLLSIGTGRPRLESFGKSVKEVGKSIIEIATATQSTANNFRKFHTELFNQYRAFRFNPPDIDVGLEEAEQKGVIATRTEAYYDDPEIKSQLQRFTQAVREEQNLEPPKIMFAATSPQKSYPFYSLTQGHKHILPNVLSYWRHLTLSSYVVYEAIYNSCKDHRGRVHFSDFSAQFLTDKTHPNTIKKVWTRLLSDQRNISNSVHPKGLAMATLYMLHIERYLPNEKPLDDYKTVGVSTDRRELLKAFGNWVPCQCKRTCEVDWNFANDTGLHRGGNAEDCVLVKVVDKQNFKSFSIGKEEEILKLTKKKWQDSRAPH